MRLSFKPFILLCSFIFLTLLVSQLSYGIYIDISSYDFSSLRIRVYQSFFLVGVALTLWGIHRYEVSIWNILLIVTFFTYSSVVVLTTSEASVIAFLISRVGIFLWVSIGLGCAILIKYLEVFFLTNNSTGIHNFFSLFLILLPIPLMITLYEYILSPLPTLRYQSASAGAIILFSLLIILHELVPKNNFIITTKLIFLAQLTFCAAVLSLAGSNSIVAFWLLAFFCIFYRSILNMSFLTICAFISLLIFLSFIFINSIFFDFIAQNSRLSGIAEGSLQISSITSRIELLKGFQEQFMVSPVFGNFMAEKYSGLSLGEYSHSIPLSLLTHTGLIGFILVSLIILIAILKRLTTLGNIDKTIFLLFLGIIGLGSLYAFFSWTPFWFFIGLVAVHPLKKIKV